jgi:uncharacterized protein YyaL (SSP411 family)
MTEELGGVQWREWSEEAFAEARAQDKPILLDIGAVWCHWCHVMDEGIVGDPVHTGTYSNSEVQKRISENFIPIKVDNDRRPDINARYNMGGWPSTVFLTPGGDTLYGETYIAPPRMVGLLDYMADLWKNDREQIAAQTLQTRSQRAQVEANADTPSDLDSHTVPTVLAHLTRQSDPQFGGFGTQPKFPHPAALLLTLEQYAQTGDAQLREIAEKTLAGMAGGGMYDQFAGGFFRYSTTRDWSIPHYEKMLEDNARLTSVYALASTVLNDSRWLDVVKSAHGWLLSEMRDPETGTFAGSQDADAEEHYYGHPLAIRATLPTPYIDRTVYAGWNALMISALVDRYKQTGEAKILTVARNAFYFLLTKMSSCQQRRRGVRRYRTLTSLFHYYAEGEGQGSLGLLADQSAVVTAALDLHEADGFREDVLVALADTILYTLEDEEDGGFYDLTPQQDAIGELARPKKDMTENAEAALALIRLSNVIRDDKYRQAAERALKVFAREYQNYGYHAAAYARAVDAALHPQLRIIIAGGRDHPDLWPLRQSAWNLPIPGKAVEWLSVGKQQYPTGPKGQPRAYVCIGTTCQIATTPQELTERLRDISENSSHQAQP